MISRPAALAAALLALSAARLDWTGVHMRASVRLPLGYPPRASIPAFSHPDPAALAASTLRTAATHFAGAIAGPESFAFGPDGTLYTGSANGTVWAVRGGASGTGAPGIPTPLAHTGGRPVGLAWDPTHARLLVACSVKGLLAVHPTTGRVSLLASHALPGRRGPGAAPGGLIFLANSVVALAPGQGGAGPAGGALLTASMDVAPPPPSSPGAWWQPTSAATAALLSGVPTGRLLRYDEATGITTALAGGLWFANGVALHRGGSAAVVAETFAGRLVSIGLVGEGEEGGVTPFSRLPGCPDGVAADGAGGLWVAIVEAPPPGLAGVLAGSRALRWLAAQLPAEAVAGGTPPVGLVVRVSAEDGRLLETLADAGGRTVRGVTSAVPGPDVVTGQPGGGRRLYLGSLGGDGVQSVAL